MDPQQPCSQNSLSPSPAQPQPETTVSGHCQQANPPSSFQRFAATRQSRKLQKRQQQPCHSMEFPERLQRSIKDDEQEEDVLPCGVGLNNRPFSNMNQSLLGLIAASNVDFHDRFEGHSSEDEGEDDDGADRKEPTSRPDASADQKAQTSMLTRPETEAKKSRKTRSGERKLLKSVPLLSKLSSRTRFKKDKSSNSKLQEEPEPEPLAGEDLSPPMHGSSLAPVMSRMREASADAAARPSFDMERPLTDHPGDTTSPTGTGPTMLSRRLQRIFGLDEAEDLIAEYPCWLLQSAMLQGYIYVTTKHICFFSYLPKKAHEVTKSGFMAKAGKRNPKYSRYWFKIKGDVLSYYQDPSNPYFPHGQIDLRYGISSSVTDRDGLHFTLETDHRTYYFRADSAQSAKDWVKSLQRVIFRSHNEGDSVKISLPINNVIDIEEIKLLDFADTCKIRVIDNDETYAVDEYFFSFFGEGTAAINVLKILVEDAEASNDANNIATVSSTVEETRPSIQPPLRQGSFGSSRTLMAAPAHIRSGKIEDHVRATLSPLNPHSPVVASRVSGEFPRNTPDTTRLFSRRSLDRNRTEANSRRSFSHGRHRSISRQPLRETRLACVDSVTESTDNPSTPSFSVMTTSGETDASQILRGSEVFHGHTVRRSQSATRSSDRHPSTPEIYMDYLPPMYHAATTSHIASPASAEKEQSGPNLDSIIRSGSYPLQRVGAFADYLGRHSKKFSGYLATESIGYAGKVSGMLRGGQKHYDEPAGLETDDGVQDEEQTRQAETRFRAHFALPPTERLRATYFGSFIRVLPLYGKIYLSDRMLCFRSLMPGTRTKIILPIRDLENVAKANAYRIGYSGLVVVIRGHEELFFEFGDPALRDDLAVSLHTVIEATRLLANSDDIDGEEKESAVTAAAEYQALEEARLVDFPERNRSIPRQLSTSSDGPTIIFDDPRASIINFKPEQSLRITCLTIGSRGDVQPYISLCKGLLAEGHKPKIATHLEFKDWIEGYGIEFAPVEGDPGELMRLCIEHGTFTVSFLREANLKMRSWLDGLLASSWVACQGSQVLIESPSGMAGIHIAERLCIPYFRAFGMPWTRTRAYPHAFMTGDHKHGGNYNWLSYTIFETIFWKATAGQINRWRIETLDLPRTNMEKLQSNKVPFLYNFSQYVVPPPLDFSDWIRVTGYWFLDEGGENWTPPADLVAFIDQARKDDKKIVYIGFGSIIIDNPAKFTHEIIDAVMKADVRCILSKGWSDRLNSRGADDNGSTEIAEIVLPPEVFSIKSAPHDWLFKQVDAAVHHGGSGTTGASLRAGIPTIIRPFFGDQFFFGGRVEDLGVGILIKKWGVTSFARALWEGTHSERMKVKAKSLGERIRSENGVLTAIEAIYRDMEYAKSLIEKKAGKNAAAARLAAASGSEEIDDEQEEESWTLVTGEEDESDVDMTLRRKTTLSPDASVKTLATLATGTPTPSDILWTTAATVTAEPGLLSPHASDESHGSAISATSSGPSLCGEADKPETIMVPLG